MYTTLRKFRLLRGYTQSQLSKLSNICPSTVAKYELNQIIINAVNADKLCTALNILPHEIIQFDSDYLIISNIIDLETVKIIPKVGPPKRRQQIC
jgi:transcriptional regulator with XRE-family HTH domain